MMTGIKATAAAAGPTEVEYEYIPAAEARVYGI